jgi:hypothetical protein
MIIMVAALLVLPTTVMLCIGLMPTLGAFFIDKTRSKSFTLCIGAMNLAGLSPYITELWQGENNIANALRIIIDARHLIIVFGCAAIGYAIDWAVSGIVSSIMLETTKNRIKNSEDRQKELIKRWGKEVTGDIPVDEYGFPLAKNDAS